MNEFESCLSQRSLYARLSKQQSRLCKAAGKSPPRLSDTEVTSAPVTESAARDYSAGYSDLNSLRSQLGLDIFCPTDGAPQSFMKIFSNVVLQISRISYTLFLLIMQVVPLLGAFVAVFQFAYECINKLKMYEKKSDLLVKSCIVALKLLGLLACITYVLHAFLVPIFGMALNVVRKVFFFL